MPRDIGSGEYHYPDGTKGNSGQTIFSARYNTFLDDLTNSLNTVLPVNMGGTGSDDAKEARDKLDAEVAGALVTDYNTHVFESGSFYSLPNAPGAPNATSTFSGISIVISTSAITLIALDRSTKIVHTRIKTGGTWELNWASIDSRYVAVTGDTMTGDLTLDNPTAGAPNSIIGAGPVWSISVGDGTAAQDFAIERYSGGVKQAPPPLKFLRNTGKAEFGYQVDVTGAFNVLGIAEFLGVATFENLVNVVSTAAASSVDTGALRVDGGVGINGALYAGGVVRLTNTTAGGANSTTGALVVTGGVGIGGALYVDGTTTLDGALRNTHNGASTFAAIIKNTNSTGAGLNVHIPNEANAAFTISNGANTFYNHNFHGDGSQISVGPIDITGNMQATNPTTGGALRVKGAIACESGIYALGYQGRAGSATGAATSNIFNIHWTGTRAKLFIDASDQGFITTSPTALNVAQELDDLKSALQAALARIAALEARVT